MNEFLEAVADFFESIFIWISELTFNSFGNFVTDIGYRFFSYCSHTIKGLDSFFSIDFIAFLVGLPLFFFLLKLTINVIRG